MSGQKDKPGWKELPLGAVAYKSAKEYKTGDWGVVKPVIDRERCTKCTLCHFFCPEGTITVRDDGYTEINLDYCKGCGICAEECPVKCIELVMKK
jgi:pyruvate ferredoxin oxidoreductase delta subunit